MLRSALPVQYKTYPPLPSLAAIVHCVWTLEGHARELGPAQPVLPDGRPEIILHLGDPFERIDSNGVVDRQPATIFAGQLLGPLVLRPSGHVAVVGIRLRPHGAAALFGDPQQELVGKTIGLDLLSTRLDRALDEVRSRARGMREAVAAAQKCLETAIRTAQVDPRVQMAVDTIEHARGLMAMDDLAQRSHLTPRHLERMFRRTVGLSPKRLARIVRFQRALRMLKQLDVPQRGTQTAAICGYADQAHFIRDFREMAGCAPGAHLLRRAELSGFFADSGR
jgi:AraC-like DNA-binding protein